MNKICTYSSLFLFSIQSTPKDKIKGTRVIFHTSLHVFPFGLYNFIPSCHVEMIFVAVERH